MIQTQSTHDSCTMKATRSIIFRTSNPYESLDLNTCKEVYNNTYLSFQYLNGRQMRQRQLKKSRFEKKLKQKNRCVEIPCIYIFIHTTGIRNRYSIVKSKSNRNNNSNSSSRFRGSINCSNKKPWVCTETCDITCPSSISNVSYCMRPLWSRHLCILPTTCLSKVKRRYVGQVEFRRLAFGYWYDVLLEIFFGDT